MTFAVGLSSHPDAMPSPVTPPLPPHQQTDYWLPMLFKLQIFRVFRGALGISKNT